MEPGRGTGYAPFLERVVALLERVKDGDPTEETARTLSKTIEKVASDIERFKFNTAVAALMIMLNELEKLSEVPRPIFLDFLKFLHRFHLI